MKQFLMIVFLFVWFTTTFAQPTPVLSNVDAKNVRSTNLTTKYITPQKIIWTSDPTGKFVKNIESILTPGKGQADLSKDKYLIIRNDDTTQHGIILDFGKEIQGGIEIVTTNLNINGKVRIRFGESVSETMSDVGENGATNDHAMRDFEVTLPRLGRMQVGESGFRFVRIDLVNPKAMLQIKEISAVFRYREIPYLGSFECNDEQLNKIWLTGAYTVHLNMQDYLWDGIKRDRLIWIGDMHPEVMTINSVFGYNEVVPKSLDYVRDNSTLPNWMNKISSYSLWWILIQRDWFYYHGDKDYLNEQKEYLVNLLHQLTNYIREDGTEELTGERFLDWPSSENEAAIHAGLQSLMIMSFNSGAELCKVLGDKETEALCLESVEKLQKHIPDMAGSKQAAALLAISGLVSPEKANSEILAKDGVHKMSTFYGYYMLIARAIAGDYQGAIDNIREYWGAMLSLGATTFWEDFNIDWKENAARIDELDPEGKIDIHATYGDYCYVGYRHSLCHGWASGPTSWMTQYILGVNVIEPGSKTIKISPHLGDLEWVKGTFPTPYGVLSIEHQKMPDGSIKTKHNAPKGVKIILK